MKFAPPPRTRQDTEAIWDGVINGDVRLIGSDHSPWPKEQEALAQRALLRDPLRRARHRDAAAGPLE